MDEARDASLSMSQDTQHVPGHSAWPRTLSMSQDTQHGPGHSSSQWLFILSVSLRLQGKGVYCPGPRFILELRPFLKESFGEEVPDCHICKDPVIRVSHPQQFSLSGFNFSHAPHVHRATAVVLVNVASGSTPTV